MNFPDTVSFVGREPLLQTLRATLLQNQRAVLAGMSGIGKTALVREYVQRFAPEYQMILWLNTATDETFLADLLAMVQALALPVDTTQGAAVLFQALHSYLNTQQNALLIMDNFPFSFAMQDGAGQQPVTYHLLIITCADRTPAEIPQLELDSLNTFEGAQLVLRQAGLLSIQATLDQAEEKQRNTALELARELHGSPLALTLAAGYMRVTSCSLQDYLFAFRDYPALLPLTPSSVQWEAQEIIIACELSLTSLAKTQPVALATLQRCALLSPQAIPEALFALEAQHISPGSEGTPLSVLLAYGLLDADQEAATLNIHPLVQDTISQFFALDKSQQHIEQTLRLFQPLLYSLERETVPTRLRVAGHIRRLAALSEEWGSFFKAGEEVAEVLSWAASLFWERQMISAAESLLRKALLIWERALGQSHPTVATVLLNLATLNALLKNYPEAEALSHRAIASKSEALGVNHPDVLLALNHLGHFYAGQEKQKEARLCYEKAISIGDRVNLRQHPFYTTCMYDLALLYKELDQFDKAEPLLRRVCVARDRSPGPQDPSTMTARLMLAEVSVRLKKWQQAETSYRRALPICEKLLGKEDPVTLNHLEHAATVFLHTGNLIESRLTFQRVLEVRERASDTDQSSITICLNGLAQIALAQKQYTEALTLLERVQSIYASNPEQDKHAQVMVLDTLSAVNAAQQQYEQAILYAQQALNLRAQIHGEEHLELVENLSNLAMLHLTRGQFQQAEPLLLQALFIYQKAQRPEDMLLDPVLNGLADIELKCGRTEMARMYLERARAIREWSLGAADPHTTEVVQKLAEVSHSRV